MVKGTPTHRAFGETNYLEVKRASLFQPHFLQWMRGSRVKLKDLKEAWNYLQRQNKRKQMKEKVLNTTSKAKKLANMLYQAHTNCLNLACFWKLVIIQLQIKILSEGVMITNFISKSWEFIQQLICKKIARVFFCLNEMRRKSQRYSNTKNAFRCQILVLRD